MTPEEYGAVLSLAWSFGAGAVLTGGIAFLFVKSYLSTYLSEKGKNLATKEDVATITRLVETERAPYTALLEELKAKHQLRLAAVDRRLQAHQEAFTKWRKLMAAMYTPELQMSIIDCQKWWDENCIYLEPEVRKAFVDAYSSASLHNTLLASRTDVEVIKASWQTIIGFPDILFGAVQLPKLSELEAKALKLDAPAPSGAPTGSSHA